MSKVSMACFIANADINVGGNLAMDDGVSDLIKYSWFNVAEGSVNKLLLRQYDES